MLELSELQTHDIEGGFFFLGPALYAIYQTAKNSTGGNSDMSSLGAA